MTVERRQFTRIQFHTNARLNLSEGSTEVEVVDLSLKGALVRPRGETPAAIGSNGVLEIGLDENGMGIAMEVAVVHQEDGYFGLACRGIDLDSITHLRRLVELNIGDESVLNRELTALARLEA